MTMSINGPGDASGWEFEGVLLILGGSVLLILLTFSWSSPDKHPVSNVIFLVIQRDVVSIQSQKVRFFTENSVF